MAYFQLSLFGKTSWERFHQATGWILEPCLSLSQIPKFQCLLPEDGQMQEWCEGETLMSHGGLWTPSIGESPGSPNAANASSSWQILEDSVPQKYYLGPVHCSRILHFAELAGCPPPKEIEYVLMKQGGIYRLSTPFKTDGCADTRKTVTYPASCRVSESQLTLFPHFLRET